MATTENKAEAGSTTATATTAAASTSATQDYGEGERMKQCPIVLVVGMAGSGKTTLVDAFSAWLEEEEDDHDNEAGPSGGNNISANKEAASVDDVGATSSTNESTSNENEATTLNETAASPLLPGEGCYVLNLDPAVTNLPYEANIDIRDTISYKKVMSEYALGPNGGILTSLNLYATRFDQVLTLVEARSNTHRAIVVDTPGQIETFTWSASGGIITDALAQNLPTVLLFVLDVPRAENAMTFVSCMLYACSIMYRTRLPMIIVMNKCDAGNGEKIESWMRDFDEFDQAMQEHSMAGVLANSIAVALEEFYKVIDTVHVCSTDGSGMNELARAIEKARNTYEREYRPWVMERRRIAEETEQGRQNNQIERLRDDLKVERISSFAPLDEEQAAELEEEKRKELEEKKALENADPEEKEAFENLMRYMDGLEVNEGDTKKSENE